MFTEVAVEFSTQPQTVLVAREAPLSVTGFRNWIFVSPTLEKSLIV
jgi:hypothetical protein